MENENHSSRKQMQEIMKQNLHVLLLRTRDHMGLKQHEMAKHYAMSNTSYSDLERGVSSCGSLTLLLLLHDQEDPKAVVDMLVENMYSKTED